MIGWPFGTYQVKESRSSSLLMEEGEKLVIGRHQ